MAARLLIEAIRFYQKAIGPWRLPSCRFVPGCSEYAVEALREHGALGGMWLTLSRLCRCRPRGGSGFDPVPPSEINN